MNGISATASIELSSNCIDMKPDDVIFNSSIAFDGKHHSKSHSNHQQYQHQQKRRINAYTKCLCLFVTSIAFFIGLACGICFAVPSPASSSSSGCAVGRQQQVNSTTNKPVVVLHSPVIAHQVITPLPNNNNNNGPPPSYRLSAKFVDHVKRYEQQQQQQQSVPDKTNVVSFVQPQQIADLNVIVVEEEEQQQQQQKSSSQIAAQQLLAGDEALSSSSSSSSSSFDSEAVTGIFWSDQVEKSLPYGYDESDAKRWRDYVKSAPIKLIEEGCGRMQNRLITFKNGTKSCARYRQNNDQIQGEIFTFYLAQLLGLRNLPPSSVGLVRPHDDQWSSVKSQLNQAQWIDERPVVMTRFLNDLQPAYIPAQFRNRHEASLNPTDFVSHKLDNAKHKDELITLAQWSDLMVLDYLTANLDRMVNNMYNMQWNQAMMDSPAHNLARDPATGLLVFLDNESGLLHGYRLLDKYEPFHEDLISSVCVFRRSTIRSLEKMRDKRSAEKLLKQLYNGTNDRRIADVLPFLPEKSIKILNQRIDRVLDQATKCRAQYTSGSSAAASNS